MIQSADVEVEPLVDQRSGLGLLGVQGAPFAVLVHQVGDDGAGLVDRVPVIHQGRNRVLGIDLTTKPFIDSLSLSLLVIPSYVKRDL